MSQLGEAGGHALRVHGHVAASEAERQPLRSMSTQDGLRGAKGRSMDALLAVLHEHSASPDEDPEVDPGRDWHLDVNSDAIRLRAYTKATWPDTESAW